MAKRPLKVFRTSIGFQDAWVAASSRKAALEAWGTTKDLFSAGLAEVVTDSKLTKAPLAQPGIVMRTARGTAAQHLAAAGKVKKPSPSKERTEDVVEDEASPPPKPRKRAPRPSRTALTRAEQALERGQKAFTSSLAEMDARIEALRKERDALRAKRDGEIAKLDDRRDREEQRYRDALDDWEG